MKKTFLFLTLLSSLTLISRAHAVYVVDDGKIDYTQICRKTTDHFPAACLIEGSGIKDNRGTGTLVAPNVVLTCEHIFSKDLIVLGPEYFIVKAFDQFGNTRTTKVKKIETFQRVSKAPFTTKKRFEYDDVAILILEEAIKDVTPATVKSIAKDTKLDSIMVMGFGRGGLLSDKPSEIDAKQFYVKNNKNEKSPLFRMVEQKKDSYHLTWSIFEPSIKIEITSKNVKIAEGDSGGAVLDQDGHIVGVNIFGATNALDLIDNEVSNIKSAVEFWQGNQLTEYKKRLEQYVEEHKAFLTKREEREKGTLVERKICCVPISFKVASSPTTTLVEPQVPAAPSLDINFEDFMTIFSKNRMKTTETIKTLLNNGKVLGSTALGIDKEMYDWIERTIQDAAPKDGKTEVTN